MNEEVTEANLVRRILEGISGGYYPNAHFLYQKLPKAFRGKYSYWDVLKLFHELEWNVKVIEIDRVHDHTAWNPWGNGIMPKRVIEYRIRQGFEGWNIVPGLFEKIIDNLHREYPKINFQFPS